MPHLHLYCVARGGLEWGSPPLGLESCPVFPIRHGDLTAVVSDVTPRSYQSMNKEDVVPYLFAHQATIEQIMKCGTVVPIKFDTLAGSEAEVQDILEAGYPAFSSCLEDIEGKIELDLLAFWRDLGSVFQEIGESEEIKIIRSVLPTLPHEEAVKELPRIGRRVKEMLDQRQEDAAKEILKALQPLVQDYSLHPMPEERMILNAAFLVNKVNERSVGETLDRLSDQHRDRIDFRLVGPIPPYSFKMATVRRFEFAEIDAARRLLGLGESALLSEVKESYRRLSSQCHPDKTGGTAGDMFQKVSKAYELLSDFCQNGKMSFQESDVRKAIFVSIPHDNRRLIHA